MTAGPDGPRAGEVPVDSPLGRRVVATTVAGSAVAVLTATVVNVALPTIADDLDASTAEQQWVINAYMLPLAALILAGGALGDRSGRVRQYRLGVAWFAAASVLCAIAPTLEVLIAARFLQGIGGALLTPGSLAIIEATLRRADRGRGVGQWSGLSGIAAALGPLVGGLLVGASWRWVFVMNLPIAVVVLIGARRIPESLDDEATGTRLDVVGAALSVLVLGGACFALIEGPSSDWSGTAVAAAVVAGVALVGLVWYEPRRDHPILPVELFADRTFTAANLITLLVYGGMASVFFLLTIHLQVTVGFSPLAAGAALLPITVIMLLLSSRGGALAQRIGPRWPLTIGPLVIAAAMLMYRGIGPGSDYLTDIAPAVVVFGLGLALSVAPVTATALSAVPDGRAGTASGVNNAVARTGQLLAVAAIPAAVGLGGDAINDPERLEPAFRAAMPLGAVLVALGGLAALVLLRSEPPVAAADDVSDEPAFHCPVESVTPARTGR